MPPGSAFLYPTVKLAPFRSVLFFSEEEHSAEDDLFLTRFKDRRAIKERAILRDRRVRTFQDLEFEHSEIFNAE